MKKNLLCMLSSLAAVFVTQCAFAEIIPPQPTICPDISAIKPVGVSQTTLQVNSLWFAGRRNNTYNTTNTWTFIVGDIPATNTVDAFQKAMVGLKTLFFQLGPFYENEWNRWVCLYSTSGGLPAVAMNPPLVSMSTNLSTYFKYH